MLFLAIAVLPHRVCGNSNKDDAVAVFLPLGLRYTTRWDFTCIQSSLAKASDVG